MNNNELTQTDIADWIASLLPPDLWERYCHLTYAQMAKIPELTSYADELRKAQRHWNRVYTSEKQNR